MSHYNRLKSVLHEIGSQTSPDRPDFNKYIEHIKTMPREHLELLVVILAGTSANSLRQYKEIIEIINNFN